MFVQNRKLCAQSDSVVLIEILFQSELFLIGGGPFYCCSVLYVKTRVDVCVLVTIVTSHDWRGIRTVGVQISSGIAIGGKHW